jgi:hypothetical protein
VVTERRSSELLAYARNVAGGATGVIAGCIGLGIAVGGPGWLKIALPALAIVGGIVTLALHTWERRAKLREAPLLDAAPPAQVQAEVTGAQPARRVAAGGVRERAREGPVVYVSASVEDEDWRRRHASVLEPLVDGRGVRVWSEERYAPAADTQEQASARQRAVAGVVIVSDSYVASARLRDELAALRARHVPLIGVLLSPCDAGQHTGVLDGLVWWRDPPVAPTHEQAGWAMLFRACELVSEGLDDLVDADDHQSAAVHASRHSGARGAALTVGMAGPLRGVPALPLGFVARGELDAIRRTLLAEGDGAVGITGRAVGLHGQGGIGKTVLAAALARDERVRACFADGMFWMTVGQDADILSLQLALLERLGVRDADARSATHAATMLGDALAERSCLLVVDDVWSVAAATAFRSVGERCRVLYTSRDADVLRRVRADVQRVDVLDRSAARALLMMIAGDARDRERVDVDRVVAATGGVALALALVGAAVAGGRAWSEVADDLENAAATFLSHPYADAFKAMQVATGALDGDARQRMRAWRYTRRTPVSSSARSRGCGRRHSASTPMPRARCWNTWLLVRC